MGRGAKHKIQFDIVALVKLESKRFLATLLPPNGTSGDADLSYHAWKAGYRVLFCPRSLQ